MVTRSAMCPATIGPALQMDTAVKKPVEQVLASVDHELQCAEPLEPVCVRRKMPHMTLPESRPDSASQGLESSYRKMVRQLPKHPDWVFAIIDEIRQISQNSDARSAFLSEAYAVRAAPEYRELVKRLRELDWHDLIEEQYFTAMCHALPYNGKAGRQPVWGEPTDWTSYEAARNFVRVVENRAPRLEDRIRLAVAKATIRAFDGLPAQGAVTPIVFSLAEPRPLRALLAPDARVAFDLDGTGRTQSWPWLRGDTGILVWDPGHTCQISSGRQLFGSVTSWLAFANGYQALDALDDDRDGEVRGSELEGLAVWTDRNADGVAQRGEVVSPRAENDTLSPRDDCLCSFDRSGVFRFVYRFELAGIAGGDRIIRQRCSCPDLVGHRQV